MDPIQRSASGQPLFQYRCVIENCEFPQGLPRTKKKAAEQLAAREALLVIFDVASDDCYASLLCIHHEGTAVT